MVFVICSLLLSIVASVVAVLALLGTKNMQQKLQGLMLENKALEKKVTEVNKSTVWIFERLMKTEKKFTELSQKQDELSVEASQQEEEPVEPVAPIEDNYDRAVSLIEQGIDSFELSERLGLSESEAKLMIMMNKSQKDMA